MSTDPASRDEDLRRLRRAVRESPGDRDAERRLQAALVRADFRDEAAARVRAGVLCPQSFRDLVALSDIETPFCNRCERHVRVARSVDALRACGGEPAAAPAAVLDAFLDEDLGAVVAHPDRALPACLLAGTDEAPIPPPEPPRPLDAELPAEERWLTEARGHLDEDWSQGLVPGPRVILVLGPLAGRAFPVDGSLEIPPGSTGDDVVARVEVDRERATIRATRPGLDLQVGDTFVGVPDAPLRSGTLVRVGAHGLVFDRGGEPPYRLRVVEALGSGVAETHATVPFRHAETPIPTGGAGPAAVVTGVSAGRAILRVRDAARVELRLNGALDERSVIHLEHGDLITLAQPVDPADPDRGAGFDRHVLLLAELGFGPC